MIGHDLLLRVRDRGLRPRRRDRVPDPAVRHEHASRVDELEVQGAFALRAIARQPRLETEAGARSASERLPRQIALGKQRIQTIRQPSSERAHPSIRVGRHHLLEDHPRDRHRERARVGGAAGRDAPGADVHIDVPRKGVGRLVAHSVEAESHAAPESFAEHDEIRRQAPFMAQAAAGELKGMRLVDAEQCAIPASERAQAAMEIRVRHDDIAVRHGGLGQHDRHVARREGPLERVQIIEGQDGGVRLRTGRQTFRIGDASPLFLADQRLLDVPVVMAAEDDDPGTLGDESRDPDHLRIGPRGRQRELPEGKAHPLGEDLAHDQRIFGRQQELRAPPRLRRKRLGHGFIPIADGHAQVAEIEIEIGVPVHVGEGRPFSLGDVQRRGPVEPGHPGHRNAERQVGRRPGLQRSGPGRAAHELLVLRDAQRRQTLAVDHHGMRIRVGHGSIRSVHRP